MRRALSGVVILLGVLVATFLVTAAIYLAPIVIAWLLGKEGA